MMPKIVSTIAHVLETTPAQHRNKEDLAKNTGVVLTKYPLKVKLENFHNSRVLELGSIMPTLVCESVGVFIVV